MVERSAIAGELVTTAPGRAGSKSPASSKSRAPTTATAGSARELAAVDQAENLELDPGDRTRRTTHSIDGNDHGMSDAARIGTLEHQVYELERQVKALTKRVDELERPRKPSGSDKSKPMPEVIVTKPRRR